MVIWGFPVWGDVFISDATPATQEVNSIDCWVTGQPAEWGACVQPFCEVDASLLVNIHDW